MDFSHIPSNFSSRSIHLHQPQQPSNSTSIMSLPPQPAPSNYISVQERKDTRNSGVDSPALGGFTGNNLHYVPAPPNQEFGPMTQGNLLTSAYSTYEPGSCIPTHGYTNFQQFSQPFENGGPPPSGTGAHGSTGFAYTPERDPSRSPETRMYADIALEGTFMRMERNDSPESNAECSPECSYAAPQLTSPANQRAATARRKRVAKYICEMCGSKLTAKHNLTSHMNAHFGIKPFRCPYCRKEYTAKSTFRRHVKTVHQDK
ncbi:hypothetical protein D9756_003224 [Leucocoprinus leucothites]|uniref:C2H2-type domain-containing protein n=1 Tax=Leucocoprinus leucothites TaxID=201217 RepID=A0A8H5G779_9AGAR|nr:hypothetical protein D9756_003224 [Leucoagaricus leucothites]